MNQYESCLPISFRGFIQEAAYYAEYSRRLPLFGTQKFLQHNMIGADSFQVVLRILINLF